MPLMLRLLLLASAGVVLSDGISKLLEEEERNKTDSTEDQSVRFRIAERTCP